MLSGSACLYAQTPILLKQNLDGRGLFSFDGKAYFHEQTYGMIDNKPWMSDGTGPGTILLSNNVRNVDAFRKAGNLVYFTAYDTTGVDFELYMTDGTMAGTGLVKDINPTGTADPYLGVEYNNKLHFIASDGVVGRALWSTDGTLPGTMLVTSFPNVVNNFARGFQVINNKLIYLANAIFGLPGTNLHVYDGTTDLVLNLAPYIADNNFIDAINRPIYPHHLEIAGNIFYAYTTGNGGQLKMLRTDGTTVTEFTFSTNANGFVNTSNAVYFRDFNVATGVELYKADLNMGNITLLADNNPSNGAGSTAARLTVFKDTLYYFYNDGVHGYELWKSDGTAAGTSMLKDIMPGSASSMDGFFEQAPQMLEFCDKLYFNANDSIHGTELWETDGSAAGTKMVADFAGGTASSAITDIATSNGRMYLFASDSVINTWNFWMIEQCYTPTSIAAVEHVTDLISVYPNPGQGVYTLSIPVRNGFEEIEVYSILGELISSQKVVHDLSTVDLKDKPNGVYVIRIRNGSEVPNSIKIIKE
jgi:ELWxxDGT repeat protein